MSADTKGEFRPTQIVKMASSGADKPSKTSSYAPSTLSVHADDPLNTRLTDVAPPIHVSTTFRYPSDPTKLRPFRATSRPETPIFPFQDPDEHCYSRLTTHSTSRLEAILSALLRAQCITYSSGLSALHALLVHLNPRRVAIGDGYHGCHGALKLHSRISGTKQLDLDCDASELQEGDLICLETPVNPTGLALDIQHYADKAHSRGAYLMVDATFGPPPLQDPFAHGADVVMHSGTKYIGGHSDILCGVLAVRPGLAEPVPEGQELPHGQKYREGWIARLLEDREFIGAVMGGLEGWLGVRSVRTMELRVLRQSASASWIVEQFNKVLAGETAEGIEEEDREVVKKVLKSMKHASLQTEDLKQGWLRKQMPNGFGPVFSIALQDGKLAQHLPSKLHLFHHATSLGGVESLIEWRTMSDATVGTDLLRVSVGVEAKEDLFGDMVQGFKALAEDFKL